MTVMRHKSVDERRRRRQRYKDAVKPIMAKFGCTSMQAAGFVTEVFKEIERLKVENKSLKAENEKLEESNKTLSEQMVFFNDLAEENKQLKAIIKETPE